MKLQACSAFFFFCVGVATNDNIIVGNKWNLIWCETVTQPKYVVHISGRSRSDKYRQQHELLRHAQVCFRRIRRSRAEDIQTFSWEQKSPTRYNDIIAGSSGHRGSSLKFAFRG